MHVKNESKKSLVRNKITQIRIGPISIGKRGVIIEKLSKFVCSITWLSRYSLLKFQLKTLKKTVDNTIKMTIVLVSMLNPSEKLFKTFDLIDLIGIN